MQKFNSDMQSYINRAKVSGQFSLSATATGCLFLLLRPIVNQDGYAINSLDIILIYIPLLIVLFCLWYPAIIFYKDYSKKKRLDLVNEESEKINRDVKN